MPSDRYDYDEEDDDREFDDEFDRPSFEELERLFHAIVAAEEGCAGAGKAAREIFLDLFPEHGQHLSSARGHARGRPADYWVFS